MTHFLDSYEQVTGIFLGDYEWAELRILRKDGRLFVACSAGCSCDCYEDNIEESDLIEIQTLAAAQREIKQFLDSYAYDVGAATTEYFDTLEVLRGLGLR